MNANVRLVSKAATARTLASAAATASAAPTAATAFTPSPTDAIPSTENVFASLDIKVVAELKWIYNQNFY